MSMKRFITNEINKMNFLEPTKIRVLLRGEGWIPSHMIDDTVVHNSIVKYNKTKSKAYVKGKIKCTLTKNQHYICMPKTGHIISTSMFSFSTASFTKSSVIELKGVTETTTTTTTAWYIFTEKNSPPMFFRVPVIGSSSKHVHLPWCPYDYVFYHHKQTGITFSYSSEEDEKLLFEKLGEIYRTEISMYKPSTYTTLLVHVYGILKSLEYLKDHGDRLRWKWMNTKSGDGDGVQQEVHEYSSFLHKQVLCMHVLGPQCLKLMESRIKNNRPLYFAELSCHVRANTPEGFGDWFRVAEPKPVEYKAKISYHDKKHYIEIQFFAPEYRGASVSFRLTEVEGTVTDQKLIMGNRKLVQKWGFPVPHDKISGRGGRYRSTKESQKKAWDEVHSLDDCIKLLQQFETKKFWVHRDILHVQIDTEQSSLLIPTEVVAPIEWWLELINESRDISGHVPTTMQLSGVREIYETWVRGPKKKNDFKPNQLLAMLIVVMSDLNIYLEVRIQIMELFCKRFVGGFSLLYAIWEKYKKMLEPKAPEVCMIRILLNTLETNTTSVTGGGVDVDKLKLILDLAWLSDDMTTVDEYSFIVPSLISIIRDPKTILTTISMEELEQSRLAGIIDENSILAHDIQKWMQVEEEYRKIL